LTAESGTAPYTPAQDNWTFTAREPFLQSEVDAVLEGLATPPAGYVGLFDAWMVTPVEKSLWMMADVHLNSLPLFTCLRD